MTAQYRLNSYAHLHLLYERIRLDHLTFSFTEVENESLDNCSAKLMRNHDKNSVEKKSKVLGLLDLAFFTCCIDGKIPRFACSA